jgi:multisubunit Na+/H+ antiporter MnhC subunit
VGCIHQHLPLCSLPTSLLHNRLVSPAPSLCPYHYANSENSDYAAKVFGFATFGKVYGLIICLAGLFNFSQSALDAVTHKAFNNNPVPVNLALLVTALIVGTTLVIFVKRKSSSLDKSDLRAEAEGAEESLMPGAEVNGIDWGSDSGRATPNYGSMDRAVSPGRS